MLTDEERRVAAERAESYPAGHGHVWGRGKLKTPMAYVVTDALAHNPRLARYG
jgi:hypothetical protein